MTLPAPPDNCGACLHAEHAVTVCPYLVRPEGENSVRAWYACLDCGHGWTTSWYLSASPADAGPARVREAGAA
jgi:hypothetical protein